ncbi:MAG: DUF4435 domain-containing protein [Muribaculaceae bacterium]|nr:DUF4435 domain-containing protein [Muribaculaceae bacterium]
MNLKLPPRAGGPAPKPLQETRRLIIVGANGAGKTRFAARMAADAGARAYSLSALRALYDKDSQDATAGSIDALYGELGESGLFRADIRGAFERLMALLLHEEMVALMKRKFAGKAERDAAPTKLDRTIALWQEVFPDNRILVAEGRILIERRDAPGAYAASRLSAGESAVLYYIGALLFAPRRAAVFVDSPEMFMHPASMSALWNRLEQLRPDCTFVYTTHDLDFAASRQGASVVWVRGCDPERGVWSYDVLPPDTPLGPEVYTALIGARKPVLFIEGDGQHSIDARLYALVFKDFTVRPLGSCNKVIEAVRSFNDLTDFHHLMAMGIVDRDRRDDREVAYLRGHRVMVPDVAEVENLCMLPDVVRAVAEAHGQHGDKAVAAVRRSLLRLFAQQLERQALEHTRHRVKGIVEHRVDCRCNSIAEFENHIGRLESIANPREIYEELCVEFRRYVKTGDYGAVLRVFNQKSMLLECRVPERCGLKRNDRHAMPDAVLRLLAGTDARAEAVRAAIRGAFAPVMAEDRAGWKE